MLKRVIATKMEGEDESESGFLINIGDQGPLLCFECSALSWKIRLTTDERMYLPEISREKIVKFLIKNQIGMVVCEEHEKYDFNSGNDH